MLIWVWLTHLPVHMTHTFTLSAIFPKLAWQNRFGTDHITAGKSLESGQSDCAEARKTLALVWKLNWSEISVEAVLVI